MNYSRDCGELLGGVLYASSAPVSIMIPGVGTSVNGSLSFHPKSAVSDDTGMLRVMFVLHLSR